MVKDFLKSQDWQFTQIQDKNVIFFGISGKNGNFQCYANLRENKKKFIFFSICGANTPLEKRLSMLELLNSFNYKLFFGNFEMDLEDGEIRFKTSVSYSNLDLNQHFIKELIMTNINIMDKSLAAIMKLMFGDISVEEAMKLSDFDEE